MNPQKKYQGGEPRIVALYRLGPDNFDCGVSGGLINHGIGPNKGSAKALYEASSFPLHTRE
jgi:hypothetical protein